ncbi:ATP-binding protein [Tepidibacter sp. Z1-5]|uniref:ATP-binding protein n=1 Tax=Tepidibacter sp. Z1-5 TaxID=3134138 RepID=UPI0030C59BB3
MVDRFYRVEESRHRQSGEIGLGLSIVKNILELHGSEYGVENTDSGVIFYFTL